MRCDIASLEQELRAGEENLKFWESELLSRLFAADERAWEAFTSAEASLQKQSALEQELASLKDQLAVTGSFPLLDFESKNASVYEEMAVPSHKISKLCADVQTGCNQMDYKL